MDSEEEKRREIRYHALRCIYFNDLLIAQCDSWLSAHEDNSADDAGYPYRERETKNGAAVSTRRTKGNKTKMNDNAVTVIVRRVNDVFRKLFSGRKQRITP